MKVQPPGPEVVEEVEVSNPWRAAAVSLVAIAVGLWLNTPLAVMVLALIVMIFLHELGHYVTAKRAGMKVTEFFIGFGPRLWSFRRGETEYGLKLIPAGAYVRIIGMSNLEEIDPADEERTYRAKSYSRRLSVAVAGSAMHFTLALVLIVVVFAGFGVRSEDSWVVGTVTTPSAAYDAGIRPGDRIVAVDGHAFARFEDMSEYLRANPGAAVAIEIERDGERLTLDAMLAAENPNGERVGFLGVGEGRPLRRVPLPTALVDGVQEFGSVVKQSVAGLAHVFSPDGISGYVDTLANPEDDEGNVIITEDRPTSVVGVAHIGSQIAENGWVNVLYLMFAVNIFIGLFNLVPMLPFDGGHVAIATYERVREWRTGRRYHADVAKLLPLTYAVVLVLALVFVTSLYLDIAHPVSVR